MKSSNKTSKQTLCVHAGQKPDAYNGINTPVYPSTAYGYLDTEARLYPRYFNTPNQEVLIEKLARLENAESGLIFSSGMAAVSAVLLSLLNKDEHVVFQKGLYGGTLNFILKDLNRFGIHYTLLKNNDPATVAGSLQENTRVVYIESPSNPLLTIMDLKEIGRICKSKDILSVIDNTFASPINQNPIDHGIDVVIHSATKYLGGHSDLCAGAVLSNRALTDRIRNTSLNLGGSINALMCYLLERSLKTLFIRVTKQNENAQQIANYLSRHPKINRVYYPGLPDHPGHEIAVRQMKGFGGMVSFELKNQNNLDFQKRLKLIRPAMSLGGVESTICAPSLTSHRHLTREQQKEDGISDGLLRLSVGIEETADLFADIENAVQ